jgi:ATP-dependent exoDNAse (exonuclease V) alpha subunit
LTRTAKPAFTLPEEFNWVDTTDTNYFRALDAALNTNDHLLIIGNGGSGKSLLIKIISRVLKGVAVCSTTGLSALNITQDGVEATTLHSFFKLKPVAVHNSEIHTNPVMQELMDATKTLIFDECSMCSNHMFDYIIETMLLYKKALARVPRMIIFADILQLPPVIDNRDEEIKKFYKERYNGKVMFFNGQYFKELGFRTINLTKIYRQENVHQQEILNRIRDESVTYADLKIINQRVMHINDYEKDHHNFIHMAAINKTVKEINDTYLATFPGEPYKYKGRSTGIFEVEKNNFEWEVVLKKDIQVMTLRNRYGHDEPEARYRNGSIGRIVECHENYAMAVLNTGEGIKIIRGESEQYNYYADGPNLKHKVVGTFDQIECRVLKALTVHRCQGMTLDYTYFTLGNWVPESLVYVALSRLKDLDNLGLSRPITMMDIKANKESLAFLSKHI